ncbi:FAD-dependent monooxygenase [Nocardia otitidiscaviarum]|uniref:FAD-dependent monooxygenase n=1 Tax=Nocardia otitidiscaviarum TaxID=1823 RepID=UPI0013BE8F89|nr:FAD-dependent monooxygenase [Nocardia otitidiscaviarum]MBF6134168.1 FAD-dependent monooxygenase [Nocardia otitidiscaviarum]MBF6484170.1 FAD-dependent monooxygenase [Nocardia otitidiscaviarum]
MMIPEKTDVLVIGGGPTGLMLAGDLARAGVAVTLVEKHAHGSELTRAFGVHARTLEQFDARGIADEVLSGGATLDKLRLFEHAVVDLGKLLDSRFPYLLITPQTHVEDVLRKRALEAGANLVTAAELITFTDTGEGVDAEVRYQDSVHPVRARYLVGADGYHSRVRETLGLEFPGKSVLKSITLADVQLSEPPQDVLAVNGVGDAFAFIAPFGDGWYRIFAWNRRNQVPDSEPVTLEELREVVTRALGTDFGMHSPRWLSRFHSDERQVESYRIGRVFLAGDAAHVHSPAGGQGMNTGIQDAANLGWKLAAAVQGWAPEGLLDTYHAERHPVGAEVLRSSGAIIRAAMLESKLGQLVRNTLAGGALSLPPVAHKVAGSLSGIGFAYPRKHGTDHLVGTRTADIELTDGRLYEALRDGKFVLVTAAATAVHGQDNRVRTVVAADPDQRPMLVRPDGYIAWVGTRGTVDLDAALADWVH